MPMPAYLPCLGMGDSSRLDEGEMIIKYCYQGYRNLEIMAFINNLHEWNISLSTLKRRLREMNINDPFPRVAPLASFVLSYSIKKCR